MRYFATYLIYIAVIARAIGWNQETAPIPDAIWILLAIYGVFLFTERALTRRFPRYPRLYIPVQSALAISMLYSAPTLDFITMLFLPLSFQVVQFFGTLVGFTWIGGFILAMAGMMLVGMEWEAGLTMVLTGGGANLLMGSFAYLMAHTGQRRRENQQLFGNLQEAYRQLKDSAAQAESLAAAEERHHLVRELHDSLTQTLFSMNLAVQAAQLSLQEAPNAVQDHLTRLQILAREAASEVQTLTGQAPPRSLLQGGLAEAIQRLAEERLAQDGLQVGLEISGERGLPKLVEANLYRIVQEALNNITRHAGVRQAQVRLSLESPSASLDVEDEGRGFDPASSGKLKGFGLVGMAERASEIGWELEIKSHPGQGTHIRVEEKAS
jgi:signal transduction histidine kinase